MVVVVPSLIQVLGVVVAAAAVVSVHCGGWRWPMVTVDAGARVAVIVRQSCRR